MRAVPYLIAEIGVNHDGSVERAATMISGAAAAGFDAVKLQHWVTDELLAPATPAARYQGGGSQAEVLDGLVLDGARLAALSEHAHNIGIDFIITADGVLALQEVLLVRVDALKIGSGDADNPLLLRAARATGLPLIVSLGMTDDDTVPVIVDLLDGVEQLTFLHCVSAYPTAVSEARLGRISWLRGVTGRPVGFSDHTIGHSAACAATALGAVTIEKHVTWSTSARGPDHPMSLDLADAAAWVREVRDVAAGMDAATNVAEEDANKTVVRKALYARRALRMGAHVEADDVMLLRPLADGIPALHVVHVVGREVARDLDEGSIVRWSDLRG